MRTTALDAVRSRELGEKAEERAEIVLMLSVIIILLTAPVGAAGIALYGPKWLSLDAPPTLRAVSKAAQSTPSSMPVRQGY